MPTCEHEWQLVETGYVRTWRSEVTYGDDGRIASVTAYYSGSEDWSDEGNGDDHLECRCCGVTMALPEGVEVTYW